MSRNHSTSSSTPLQSDCVTPPYNGTPQTMDPQHLKWHTKRLNRPSSHPLKPTHCNKWWGLLYIMCARSSPQY